MRCGCIDIGSNTTRLLVADVDGDRLSEVAQQRVMTRIGRDLEHDGAIGDAKRDEVVAVVREQLALARRHEVRRIRVIATHAIRGARNGAAFCAALREAVGHPVDVLDGHEEARLAFLGATKTFPEPLEGTVGVVDVGGGSSEIAIGELRRDARAVFWSSSVPIGSSSLARAHFAHDPPAPGEIAAARAHAHQALGELAPPAPDVGVAVGGSAASLRVLIGDELCPASLDRALGILLEAPAVAVAHRSGLLPERVRLMPAGLLVLEAAAQRLGVHLLTGRGGIREGVCLELAAG